MAPTLLPSRSWVKSLGPVRWALHYLNLSWLPLYSKLRLNLPSRTLSIISSKILHLEMLTDFLMSSLNIPWHIVFFISISTIYYKTNNALSLNMAVISATVSIILRRSWSSLANYCTSITSEISTLNLITKSSHAMDSTTYTFKA